MELHTVKIQQEQFSSFKIKRSWWKIPNSLIAIYWLYELKYIAEPSRLTILYTVYVKDQTTMFFSSLIMICDGCQVITTCKKCF